MTAVGGIPQRFCLEFDVPATWLPATAPKRAPAASVMTARSTGKSIPNVLPIVAVRARR